ncbi:relaxase/mobilization nuclease domain-containing protein [Nisaea denitrificans]|uniref:relaxase/mobilization nuclease domain-containing protein n=1 Tax=Nisaea denitrificans TaxID=390877 RepID=UPI0004186B84|nr:hypothetical protein [Nisaea denitrificans]
MIVGATRGSGGRALARHLTDVDENERVQLLEARGLASDDLANQLGELVAGAAHGRSAKPVMQVHLDPSTVYTEQQWERVLELYEAEFGLQDHTRLAVEHKKKDRTHRHYVYSLVNENGRVIDLAHNFARHEKVARIVEFEFGEKFTSGRFDKEVLKFLKDERPDVYAAMIAQGCGQGPRTERAVMNSDERFQAARQGVNLADVRSAALTAWKASDSPQAFEAALAERGFALAQGTKTTMIIDQAGNAQSLSRVLNAASKEAGEPRIPAADVQDRIAGLQIPPLAQLGQARVDVRAPAAEQARPAEPASKSAGPSIGTGSGTGAGSSVSSDTIAPIDMEKPGDFERFLRQFAADLEKKMNAAHQIQMAAIKRGSQGSAEAAQRLATALQRATTRCIREGERYARQAERRALHEASKFAAAGRYADAIERFEGAWQSLSEDLVDGRLVGDPRGDDQRPDVDNPHAGSPGPEPDGLRGDRGGADHQQPIAASQPSRSAGRTVSEPADLGSLREHSERSDRDQRQAIRNRVEDARRDIELGRHDATERLERLVVQSAVIARQQQNPATPEPAEAAHQRLKRDYAAYRDQHKQREKGRWTTAFSRQREIAGVARALIQRGDVRLAPVAARQLRAATLASNTKLRDVLRQTKPAIDTYAAFVQRRAELDDPAAQQVHQFIVGRQKQKQSLLQEVDRVRDERLVILASDPWPDAKSRNAKLLADDARRQLEKPRAVAVQKVEKLERVADEAEALIGRADRIAQSVGIITERVRDAELARNQADAARVKLEPAETYEFRVKAARATAEHTARQRQAEHEKWRATDVTTAERDLEIAHRIDAAIQSHDQEICRCRTYQDAVRVVGERLKREREERRRQQIEQQRELERQQALSEPAAGFLLGPRMR